MNCLYITLFFNIVAGIVQTFIKSWKELQYPRVIEVCRLPFEPRHDFLHLIIVVQLLRWEIVWQNAPRIWRDFGSALPFQTRLTQTKPVIPLSDEHGSQVKDQGRRQCCHNKHKKFSHRPTRDVSLLSGNGTYFHLHVGESITINEELNAFGCFLIHTVSVEHVLHLAVRTQSNHAHRYITRFITVITKVRHWILLWFRP